jgi:hypothetical protein
MLPAKYLLDHIEALIRLSHEVSDRAISAKLQEMADELRIMVSVADVTDFATALSTAPAAAAPIANEMVAALYETKPKRKRKAKKRASDEARSKPKRRAEKRVE